MKKKHHKMFLIVCFSVMMSACGLFDRDKGTQWRMGTATWEPGSCRDRFIVYRDGEVVAETKGEPHTNVLVPNRFAVWWVVSRCRDGAELQSPKIETNYHW